MSHLEKKEITYWIGIFQPLQMIHCFFSVSRIMSRPVQDKNIYTFINRRPQLADSGARWNQFRRFLFFSPCQPASYVVTMPAAAAAVHFYMPSCPACLRQSMKQQQLLEAAAAANSSAWRSNRSESFLFIQSANYPGFFQTYYKHYYRHTRVNWCSSLTAKERTRRH